MTGLESHAIVSERRQLLNMAYRLLGSLTDAEDVLQETCARWYALSPQQRDAIESPGAWLTRVAGRICLDLLGSARVRRERYVGEWVPEPLPDRGEWSDVSDPADQVTLDESVTTAFLVVPEQMRPCRKRTDVPAARQADVVRGFKEAWEAKDIGALIALLDPASAMVADGGGLAGAALRPVEGGERIARYLVGMAQMVPELRILVRTVNGRPGLVATHDGVAVTVAAFEVEDDRITRIWAVRNPEKLRHWRTER